jgi:hypothetical protein
VSSSDVFGDPEQYLPTQEEQLPWVLEYESVLQRQIQSRERVRESIAVTACRSELLIRCRIRQGFGLRAVIGCRVFGHADWLMKVPSNESSE